MTPSPLLGVTVASSAAPTPSFAWTPSAGFTALMVAAWVVTLVLIALAIRANWGIAQHVPQWLVTVTLIAVGALGVVAFVSNTAWVAIAAIYGFFALWLLFLFRWLFPTVHEYFTKARGQQVAATQEAERAACAQRGTALEHVLDDAVREGRRDGLKPVH